jgi:hypothetical protein
MNNLSSLYDETPPNVIKDLVVTKITFDSITINWTAPADNGTNKSSGPVQGYDIRFSTNNSTLANWSNATQCVGEPFPLSPGTRQEFNITGLSPNTTYFIAIVSKDERPNFSPISNIVKNNTKTIIDTIMPGAVMDLKITEITISTITLNWSAPCDNGTNISSGPVQRYNIRYSTSIQEHIRDLRFLDFHQTHPIILAYAVKMNGQIYLLYQILY